jgi:hypothetical protein
VYLADGTAIESPFLAGDQYLVAGQEGTTHNCAIVKGYRGIEPSQVRAGVPHFRRAHFRE